MLTNLVLSSAQAAAVLEKTFMQNLFGESGGSHAISYAFGVFCCWLFMSLIIIPMREKGFKGQLKALHTIIDDMKMNREKDKLERDADKREHDDLVAELRGELRYFKELQQGVFKDFVDARKL